MEVWLSLGWLWQSLIYPLSNHSSQKNGTKTEHMFRFCPQNVLPCW